MTGVGRYATPPLKLFLALLKKSLKDSPHMVVYVDLLDKCVLDWSAASKKRKERVEKHKKIDPDAKKAMVAANIAAGGNGRVAIDHLNVCVHVSRFHA